MTLPIRFLPDARAEFDADTDWYADRGAELGRRFVAAVGAVVRQAAGQPRLHGVVYQDVRKAIVQGFPYIVLYREDAGELIVVSVFHTSRDPADWQRRV